MMTSTLMCCLRPGTSLLLLLVATAPTLTAVVRSISDCDQFFLQKTPPHVPGILEGGKILNQNRYKPICQTFQNHRRFVTLYDVDNKIPMFSAYHFVGSKVERPKRPKTPWKIEPQLENENADRNMMPVKTQATNQAVRSDYQSEGEFDRGHIFPSSHAFTEDDKKSTFTLTNIVPQAESFNKGSWSNMEKCVKSVMETYCITSSGGVEGFVVTGAQPSDKNILNNKINIPSMLWSAFCCYNAKTKTWIASAHWGDNVQENRSEKKCLKMKTLAELSDKLSDKLTTADSKFEVFPGSQCPLNTTPTKFTQD